MIYVAASNSSAADKARADYICDGVDDQVEINNAIQSLAGQPGTVTLLSGDYNIGASTPTAGIVIGQSGLTLTGEGWGTRLRLQDNADVNMIRSVGDALSNIVIKDMYLDGNAANNSSGYSLEDRFEHNIIRIIPDSGTTSEYLHHDVWVTGVFAENANRICIMLGGNNMHIRDNQLGNAGSDVVEVLYGTGSTIMGNVTNITGSVGYVLGSDAASGVTISNNLTRVWPGGVVSEAVHRTWEGQYDNVISNNTIIIEAGGIVNRAIEARGYHNLITGNYITAPGGSDYGRATVEVNNASSITDNYFKNIDIVVNGTAPELPVFIDGNMGINIGLPDEAGIVDLGTNHFFGTTASSSNLILSGTNGDDFLIGAAGLDQLSGGAGNDVLNGGRSADLLQGDEGDDWLDGGQGTDTLIGGVGNDTYVVDKDNDVLIEYAGEGVDTIRTTLAQWTLAENFENLIYTGYMNFIGTGNNNFNIITGGLGNDSLYGYGGNDTINGSFGDDYMVGGDGSDLYYVNSADDVVIENINEGNDIVNTTVNYYSLADNVENLTFIGVGNFVDDGNDLNNIIISSAGSDTLTGGLGNDTLNGGVGADNMYGGMGNDIFIVDDPFDTPIELPEEGVDEVRTIIASYALGQNIERLTYTGTDSFVGMGNELDNRITGGAGNDIIDGGIGVDVMIGGVGDDVYKVDNAGDIVTEFAGGGIDTVEATSQTYILSANVENLTFVGTGNFIGTGNALDNVITGGDGDDILEGREGGDSFIGGLGSDTVSYANANSSVKLDMLIGGSLGEATGDSYLGIENIIGSNFADQIFADSNGNVINGLAGDDVLYGRSGDDVLFGGENNDTLYGDQGADIIDGGNGFDTASYMQASSAVILDLDTGGTLGDALGDSFISIERVFGSNGFGDEINGSQGADQLRGLGGNDILRGEGGNDILGGDAGDDLLEGGDGNDLLYGGLGNDTLQGGAGNDTMRGEAGDDIYEVDSSNDIVVELFGEGIDEILSSLDNYTLGLNVERLTYTGTANATLTGNDLDNRLIGGQANDTLNGGSGADQMLGGAGDDVYIVDQAGDDAIELAGEGIDEIRTVLNEWTLGQYIEILTYTGNGSFIGTGNSTDNVITGGDSNNTLFGLSGDDTLIGGNGEDILNGGDGNDTVSYANSASGVRLDLISGGTVGAAFGDKYFSIENIIGSQFADQLYADAAGNLMQGLGGDDVLYGRAGDDQIYGDSGNDTLYGAEGADRLDGGDGFDTASYSLATSAVGLDLDTGGLFGDAIGDVFVSIERVFGSNGFGDELNGSAFSDQLRGLGGNDILRGEGGNDILGGDAGDDHLTGGSGNDALDGGLGFDVAYYAGAMDSYAIVTQGGQITVVDNQPNVDGNDGVDVIVSIEQLSFLNGETANVISPIILDLDGLGVETLSAAESSARYDLNGDGFSDNTSWMGATEGLLVLDRDGNGKLSGAHEFSFVDDVSGAKSDIQGLRHYDSNADGQLNSEDSQFGEFYIWQDKNGDGISTTDEFFSLADAGVVSIDLNVQVIEERTELGEVAIVNTGSYTRADGTQMAYIDAALTYFATDPKSAFQAENTSHESVREANKKNPIAGTASIEAMRTGLTDFNLGILAGEINLLPNRKDGMPHPEDKQPEIFVQGQLAQMLNNMSTLWAYDLASSLDSPFPISHKEIDFFA